MCDRLGWGQGQNLHVAPTSNPATLVVGAGALRPRCQAQHALTCPGPAWSQAG